MLYTRRKSLSLDLYIIEHSREKICIEKLSDLDQEFTISIIISSHIISKIYHLQRLLRLLIKNILKQ